MSITDSDSKRPLTPAQKRDAFVRQHADKVLYQYLDAENDWRDLGAMDTDDLHVTGTKEDIQDGKLVAVYTLSGFKRMRVKTTRALISE